MSNTHLKELFDDIIDEFQPGMMTEEKRAVFWAYMLGAGTVINSIVAASVQPRADEIALQMIEDFGQEIVEYNDRLARDIAESN